MVQRQNIRPGYMYSIPHDAPVHVYQLFCLLQMMTSLLEEAMQPLSDLSYYGNVHIIQNEIQVP